MEPEAATTAPAPAAPAGDPRIARCGFAKLVGEGVDYYMQKYEVSLGQLAGAQRRPRRSAAIWRPPKW